MVKQRIVGKRPWIPRICSKTGTTCKEWRSQLRTSRWTGRSSTDRIKRWRWSSCRLLVCSRWLKTSWPHWTSSSTLCAEWRNISIPLTYTEVTRVIYTDLDVLQGRRIDDNWSVDSNRSLSDSWTGFTMFTLLKENSNGKHVVRGVTDKTQATARPENVCPETWIKIGKATQKREKRKQAPRQRSKVEPDNGEHNGNLNCGENSKFWWRCGHPSKKRGSRSEKSTHRVRLRKLKGDGLRPYPMPKNEACSVKTVQDTESSSQCLLGARLDLRTSGIGGSNSAFLWWQMSIYVAEWSFFSFLCFQKNLLLAVVTFPNCQDRTVWDSFFQSMSTAGNASGIFIACGFRKNVWTRS